MKSRTTAAVLCGIVAFGLAGGMQLSSPNSKAASPPPTPTATSGGSTADLQSLQSATIGTAATVSPKVVEITSASGLGSGEILDARGYIVTNFHVLSGGGATLQPPFAVVLSNGHSYPATVAGTDANDDLAVLRIHAGTLKPITLGNSSDLRVGQFVLAIGNPLGYAQTVTFGIVSTLGRGLAEGQPAAFLPDLIQTSAPINPGNSGGALVDLQGRLVGIPTLAAQDPELGGAAQGIGFAIPVNRVKFIADQIIATGHVANSGRAYLGVQTIDVTQDMQSQYGLPVAQGVAVYSVTSGGPAAKVGLKQGDIIVAFNNVTVTSSSDLLSAIASVKPGQKVALKVVGTTGKSTTRTVMVTLGTLPIPSSH